MTLGECIKKTRLMADFTVAELSEQSGVPMSTIWRYESHVILHQIENLIALADVLGVSVDTLIGHEPKRRKKKGARRS